VLFRPYEPRERLGQSLTVADVHLVNLRPEFEGLIVPSKYYGVAAAGRPCIFIGDPEGEIGSLVREVDAGITVGDGKQLANAILYLYRNPERRQAMGSAARRRFELQFDRPLALARWEALVTSLCRSA
jgi:glycosyltransferase involved in cell wall biosynthesis